jgi:hypothetical protein
VLVAGLQASSISRPRKPEQSMKRSPSSVSPVCRSSEATKPSSGRRLTLVTLASMRRTPFSSATRRISWANRLASKCRAQSKIDRVEVGLRDGAMNLPAAASEAPSE